MKKLKIYLETTKDAQDAEALFEELGYEYSNPEGWFLPFWIIAGPGKTFQKVQGEFNGYKYIDLQELEGLVILNRNDPNDATHADYEGRKAIFIDESWYYWNFNSEKWRRHTKRSLSDPSKLKPIQKLQNPQPAPEPSPLEDEYLNIKTGELLQWDKGQPRSTNWIEVPEGADIAVQFDNIYFYNDKFEIFTENGWQESGFESIQQFTDLNGTVIWQRDPHPEKQSLNDIAKTAEDHRQQGYRAVPRDPSNPHSDYVVDPEPSITDPINDLCDEFGCLPGMDRLTWLREQLQKAAMKEQLYQYAASINTPRGTMHYDGLIAFPGRITGIEDYHQVRAEIAKDGNTTPDKVNVHSLNIVG